MFFDEITFGTVISATAGGAAAYYFDEQNKMQLIQLDAAKFGEIIPENGMSGEWEDAKYRPPGIGSAVAFELDLRANGSAYAAHWTTAAQYAASELEARSDRIRIMCGDICLWAGKFAYNPDIVYGVEGNIPDILTDEMRIEYDAPDDIADTAYETSFLVEGGWNPAFNQEAAWVQIIKARPLTV